MRVHGVLERLLAEFVSAQMVSLTVGHRCSGVCVSSKIVKLRDRIVRTWHGVLLNYWWGGVIGTIQSYSQRLAGVPIFFRNIVFWDLARGHLRYIGTLGVFYTICGLGFERVSLLDQLLDALRTGTGNTRYSL
jgi:hypothetical protein